MTRTSAVGYRRPGPPEVLEDVEIDVPDPRPHDLLVEIRAVSVMISEPTAGIGPSPRRTVVSFFLPFITRLEAARAGSISTAP